MDESVEPGSERAQAIALAAAGVSVWVWDARGETCRVSGGALVGLPADTTIGRDDLVERVSPDDRDAVRRALRELPARGRIDVRFRVAPDGVERWLELRGWREHGGTVVAACKDVSDEVRVRQVELRRRQVVIRQNQALRRMAGRLVEGTDLGTILNASCTDIAHALEVARVGVWILDEGNELLRCLTRVDSGAGMIVPGDSIEASACPRYFEAIRRDRAIVADDAPRDPLTAERAAYFAANGVTSVLDAPCRIGGRVIGVVCHEHVGEQRSWTLEEQAFVGSVADQVSLVIEGFRRREVEQVQVTLEDSLRQAQKMEAVGLLAGGVAHDLNNLLTPVLMCSEMLQEDLREQPASLELVESIVTAALDARGLVGQLLAFSRKQVLELRDLDPAEEVRRTVKLLRRTLPETITIELELEAGVVVRADAMQLQQVLLNLAINSRDAMPGGGVLKISVLDDVDEVRIVVADTGCGMDEETVPHIFEPFFTTKGLARGTGLGLSTVYGIVQQHGGSIRVTSVVGQGTRFEIRLPASGGVPSKSSEIRIIPAALASSGRASHTILVVEDEPAVRGLVIRLLGREGYHVLSAPGPEDAIRLAAGHPHDIHLVLTDVVMPGMNGRRMFDEIKAVRPATRVVYMSGYDQDVLAPQGVLASSVRLLRKPFTAADLLRTVAEALRTENGASPVDKPPVAL
ncbi:MAG TPA: ATP-binding protein [Kofleriaceae bacterium]|nr:ATP-binding protein [Kofleriaceae bacterium]